MKSILVAVDFSENAKNAARYALSFAKEKDLSLTFFHSYMIPTTGPEFVDLIDLDEFQSFKQAEMKHFLSEVEAPDSVKIEMQTGIFPVDDILNYANENKIDLIVVGLKGHSKVEELFMGSTALSLFRNGSIPVLGIPLDTGYPTEFRIGLGFDGEDIHHTPVFDYVKDFVTMASGELVAFSILNPNELINEEVRSIILNNYLSQFPHKMIFHHAADLKVGIDEIIEQEGLEILALIPKKHSFFERLFGASDSTELARNSKIPLLFVPDLN